MARVIAASEANQNFSKLLRELKKGDPVTITQRGRVRARLVDAEDGVDLDKQAQAFEAALAHYRTLDRVMLRGWTRDSLYDRDPWTRPGVITVALDTNILAYAIGVQRHPDDDAKIERARALLSVLITRARLVVAVQVLLELHNVLSKVALSRSEAGEEVERVQTYAQVIPTDIATMTSALWLSQRHRFSIFDAVIVCASSDTGADWLLTEDMQDGFLWRTMRLFNPLALALPDVLARLGLEV